MRVCMVSVGSRGDAEPYCALTQELLKRHHVVDLFLQPNLRHLVAPFQHQDDNNFQVHDLPFTNVDFYNAVNKNKTPRGNEHPDRRMKSVGMVADIMRHLVLPCMKQVQEVAKDCDVMLSCALARPLCLLVSRICQIPMLLLHLQPLVPNRLFPNYRVSRTKFVQTILKRQTLLHTPAAPILEDDSTSASLEETYWRLEHALEEFFLKKDTTQAYVQAGQMPISWEEMQAILAGHHANVTIVNAYSNHLIPSIVGTGPNVYEVGPLADSYLSSNFDGTSNAIHSLQEFLLSCQHPPICIGFGSMPFSRLEILREALRELDLETVLVGDNLISLPSDGDSGIRLLPRQQWFHISSTPYSYLLPKCALMVCHGGAGVVNSCLYADIPMVVCPVMGDQFAFAELIEAFGLGVYCKAKLFSASDLVQAIRQAMDIGIGIGIGGGCCRDKCRALGERIRQEDSKGVEVLASLLEEKVVVVSS
jgi:UDP:flavonoid glycosyltransferase YjiC (YdhE family)